MIIQNELCTVEISEHAAEITSFRDAKTGREYMWQGDATYWSGRNPILFPMVGNTYSKTYEIDGKTYAMGNHGVARNATFTCVNEEKNRIVMRLESSADTLAVYPFPFCLDVSYTLCGTTLQIEYHITNTGDRDMPFSFGLHPAFRCPLDEGEDFRDYRIELACAEKVKRFDFEQERFVREDAWTKSFALDYDVLFKTIMLEGFNSPYVQLTNGKHGVEVSCAGYRWIAFWTKPNAPFVCLEPWHGLGDRKPNNLPFDKRPGTMSLAGGHTYTTSYSIRIF